MTFFFLSFFILAVVLSGFFCFFFYYYYSLCFVSRSPSRSRSCTCCVIVLLCYSISVLYVYTMLSLMYLVSVLCVMRIINSKLWMMYNNVCNDKTLYVRGSCKPKKRLRRNKMKKKGRREGGRIEFRDG